MSTATKKILIVDSDAAGREKLSHALHLAGYNTYTEVDGNAAIRKLSRDQNWLLVIAGYTPGKSDVIQLLQWLRKERPSARFVLTVKLPADIEGIDFKALGCTAILTSPLTVEKVTQALKESEESYTAFSEADYARVAIDDFISGKKASYSIFVRFAEGKLLKVAHTGDDMDLERLREFKKRGVKELWLHKDDFAQYQALSAQLAAISAQRPELAEKKRATLVRHACEVASENLRLAGLTEATLSRARTLLADALEILSTDSASPGIMEALSAAGDMPYCQAATCGMLACLTTKNMGWTSRQNILSIGLAAFVHDAGMNQLSPEVRVLSPEKMTSAQRAEFEKHPAISAAMLDSIPKVPRGVYLAVLQHHENPRGTGFPQGLLRSDIFPMARILGVLDYFVNSLQNLSPSERKTAPSLVASALAEEHTDLELEPLVALHALLLEPEPKKAQALFQREFKALFNSYPSRRNTH